MLAHLCTGEVNLIGLFEAGSICKNISMLFCSYLLNSERSDGHAILDNHTVMLGAFLSPTRSPKL